MAFNVFQGIEEIGNGHRVCLLYRYWLLVSKFTAMKIRRGTVWFVVSTQDLNLIELTAWTVRQI